MNNKRILVTALCLLAPLSILSTEDTTDLHISSSEPTENVLQDNQDQEQEAQVHISYEELEEIFQNPDKSYICFSKTISYLPAIIEEISKIDADEESPVHALKKHMDLGYVIGRYDAVVDVLNYAQLVLDEYGTKTQDSNFENFTQLFTTVYTQVTEGAFNLDAEKLAFLKNDSNISVE